MIYLKAEIRAINKIKFLYHIYIPNLILHIYIKTKIKSKEDFSFLQYSLNSISTGSNPFKGKLNHIYFNFLYRYKFELFPKR